MIAHSEPISRRAFTLVEVVAAMTIMSIIGIVSSNIVFNAVRALDEETSRAQLNLEMSSGLSLMVDAFRAVDKLTGPAPNISAMSATRLTASIGGIETTWSYSDSTLSVSAGGATQSLVDGLTSFAFVPIDRSGNIVALPISSTAGAAPVQRIQITMTGTRAGRTDTLRTEVFLRNLMRGN
jgi:prepilin-type N-terminal cleavage/methylation domain-containing protein